MITVNCDVCKCKVDYEENGINLNFNHFGKVRFNGNEITEKEFQLCNKCAKKVSDHILKIAKESEEE